MKKVIAIIQARVGSTRLPNKVLKKIQGKTILNHVIERVSKSKYIDEIIVATTDLKRDDEIINECKRLRVKNFRGSEDDVLSRYYYSAKKYGADIIIRITSDCPLIDPVVIDELVKFYIENDYEVVTNAIERTYPRGLDTEVFSFNLLEDAFYNAKEKYQREHVTPYIYEKSKFTFNYKNIEDYSKYRITVDTKEDFELIEAIYKELYKGEHNFYMSEIIKLLENNNTLVNINSNIKQKSIK